LRLARGWTQQDVADRLVKLGWMRKPRKNLGTSAEMVGKWERGAKGVSPLYRELLAKLFGVTIDQLGLIPRAQGATATTSPEDRSLVAFLDTATSLLDQLGAAGAVLQPQMFALWKEEIANRRAMFALLDPTTAGPGVQPPSAPLDLDTLDQLADKYERLHETADPAALLTPVAAHVRMVGDALRSAMPPGDRERLLRNRARVAVLAGRIAYEGLGNAMSARAFYSTAYDDARELGDDNSRAVVLGRSAILSAGEARSVAAAEDLAAAARLVRANSPIGLWLAEAAASVGLVLRDSEANAA
jgi:transcriptional regulator with XRE-family HTH domain